MNNLKVRSFTRVFGIVACVLLIVAFPLYYPFVRAFANRLRYASKTPQGRLSLLDKVDLTLEYELNKRIRGLGVGLYRLTGGRITRFAQAEVLLLTTRGRRSGKARTVLLQFFRDGANLVILAANSGRSSHPDWFYNLKATPTAQVQVMDRTLQVHAEELSTDEASAFWPYILRVAPANAKYQKATSRPIPLVRLVPVGQAGEQTMPGGEALPDREEISFTG
jgi:deazaflavin-dependent oxidoreductase (nitroreductase family)